MKSTTYELDRLAHILEDSRAIAIHRSRSTNDTLEEIVFSWGDSRAKGFSNEHLSPMVSLMPELNRQLAQGATLARKLVADADRAETAIERVATNREVVADAVSQADLHLNNARFYCSESSELAARAKTGCNNIERAISALGSPGTF